jgi:hypothetical protein
MPEHAKPSFLPLISQATVQNEPEYARHMLTEYWKQQANITRWHLEEFGVARKELEQVNGYMEEVLFEDALRSPETFGREQHATASVDGHAREKIEKIAETVSPEYRQGVMLMGDRYIDEQKRRCIFEFTENCAVVEVCEANGGIPGWTSQEQKLTDQFLSEE